MFSVFNILKHNFIIKLINCFCYVLLLSQIFFGYKFTLLNNIIYGLIIKLIKNSYKYF